MCGINGYRLDRDWAENIRECHNEIIKEGTELSLIVQSSGCVASQLNISVDAITSNQFLGIALSEPALEDYGYHSLHLVRLALSLNEVLRSANLLYGENQHTRYRPITEEHAHQFNVESLIEFAHIAPEVMAMTQVPLIWVALSTLAKEKLVSIDGLIVR